MLCTIRILVIFVICCKSIKIGGNEMKKSLLFLLIFMLVMTSFADVSSANGLDVDVEKEAVSDAQYVEGQLIVSVEPSKSKAQVAKDNNGSIRSEEARLSNKGFKVVDSLHNEAGIQSAQAFSNDFNKHVIDHMGLVYLVEYSPEDYKNINQAKQAIKKELKELGYKVRYVEKNYEMEAIGDVSTEDVSINMHPNQRWHYEMINAPDAWNITTGSSQVRIAILDTGIDHNHPNLRNITNTNLGRSFVGGTPIDRQGHGTHVAGTVASYGSVSGVMQNAELVSVKVLNDQGSGTTFGIQQGVLYAAEIGSDVINMSLGGGGFNQGMADACQAAVNAGTIVIAAAGNDGRAGVSYPAAYNSVIAVGSVTSNRTRSSFSNFGNGLEVMAPGSNIYSTYPNGQYRTLSGTSMAAPHAAGVAGLMRAVNPNLSVANARQILRDTAQDAGSSYYYGYGIVDALAAVIAAGGGSQPENETQTSVTTNKSVYERGETVNISATVTDQNNRALQGASVDFTITRPNGTTITQSATTNASGVATWNISSSSSTALGDYTVRAETSLSGYAPSSDTATFTFAEQSNQTFTSVSTNKTEYVRGETVTMTAQVTNAQGQGLANAQVQFTITRPNGTTLTNTATTNSSGVATWSVSSSSSTATGVYQVRAVASLSGYDSSSDTTSFRIR